MKKVEYKNSDRDRGGYRRPGGGPQRGRGGRGEGGGRGGSRSRYHQGQGGVNDIPPPPTEYRDNNNIQNQQQKNNSQPQQGHHQGPHAHTTTNPPVPVPVSIQDPGPVVTTIMDPFHASLPQSTIVHSPFPGGRTQLGNPVVSSYAQAEGPAEGPPPYYNYVPQHQGASIGRYFYNSGYQAQAEAPQCQGPQTPRFQSSLSSGARQPRPQDNPNAQPQSGGPQPRNPNPFMFQHKAPLHQPKGRTDSERSDSSPSAPAVVQQPRLVEPGPGEGGGKKSKKKSRSRSKKDKQIPSPRQGQGPSVSKAPVASTSINTNMNTASNSNRHNPHTSSSSARPTPNGNIPTSSRSQHQFQNQYQQNYPLLGGGQGGAPSAPTFVMMRPIPTPVLGPPPHLSFSPLFYAMLDPPEDSNWMAPLYQAFEKLPIINQVIEMQRALSLTREDHGQRLMLLEDLRTILQREFPFCEMYPFGSFLTGLGDATSDVDVYFDAYGVTKGNKLPGKGAGTLDILDCCYRLVRRGKCPRSYRSFCKMAIPIREARVPILKITHYSEINVDLSFENLTSLRNSHMISFYMQIDPCVRPLIILIRFFAKYHGIVGSSMIKNYCFILMVIVFLAQKKIVPTVEELQRLRAEEKDREKKGRNVGVPLEEYDDPDIIAGWNTGFTQDIALVRRSCNLTNCYSIAKTLEDSVLVLAKEFFELYGSLSFSEMSVCSYTAAFIKKDLFKPGYEEDLPDSLDRYKEWAVLQFHNRRLNINTALCVQDPFILSFNVGATASLSTLVKFQVACKEAAKVIGRNMRCILEIYRPLPGEVGDRKFLDCLLKHRQTIKFKNDVTHFLETGELRNSNSDLNPASLADEVLNLHRELTLDEYLAKQQIRYGKGWESAHLLPVSPEFQHFFADTVIRFNMHTYSNLVQKVKTLWLQYVVDFVTNDFWNCFHLGVSHKVADKMCETRNSGRTTKPLEHIFHPRKGKKEEKETASASSSKAALNSSSSAPRPDDVLRLTLKLNNVQPKEEKIVFGKLTCSAFVKFWAERQKTACDVINELVRPRKNKEEAKASEGSNSKELKKSKSRSKINKLRKQLYDGGNWDPLSLEARITEEVLQKQIKDKEKKKHKKNTSVCDFVILFKIDNTQTDQWPCLVVVVDQVDKKDQAGAQCVMEILGDVFEPYCLYRLKRWFKESIRDGPLSPEEEEDEENSPPTDQEGDEENKVDDDYDLLMPPSSSSSSSASTSASSSRSSTPVPAEVNPNAAIEVLPDEEEGFGPTNYSDCTIIAPATAPTEFLPEEEEGKGSTTEIKEEVQDQIGKSQLIEEVQGSSGSKIKEEKKKEDDKSNENEKPTEKNNEEEQGE